VVVAENLRTAQRALEKIRVEYEPLPAVFDATEALDPGAPIPHEERGTNLLLEDSLAWGDIEEGFRQADRVFEETYISPSMFHHPMEPIGGCLAQYINGEINLWLPTSSPMRDAGAAHNSVISAWGCYRIPHVRIRGGCVYTNKVPAGHTRATGKVQTTWGIECTVDSIARQLNIDPYEFRKKNVLLRGEFVAKG